MKSDNRMLSKVVLALASLCSEMQSMSREAEARFFHPLSLYGAGVRAEEEGGKQMALSRVLPILRSLSDFQVHSAALIGNAMRQVRLNE